MGAWPDEGDRLIKIRERNDRHVGWLINDTFNRSKGVERSPTAMTFNAF